MVRSPLLKWTVDTDASNSTSAQAIRIARAVSARSSGWPSRFECACIRGQGKKDTIQKRDTATERRRDGATAAVGVKTSGRCATHNMPTHLYAYIRSMCQVWVRPAEKHRYVYVLQNVLQFNARDCFHRERFGATTATTATTKKTGPAV